MKSKGTNARAWFYGQSFHSHEAEQNAQMAETAEGRRCCRPVGHVGDCDYRDTLFVGRCNAIEPDQDAFWIRESVLEDLAAERLMEAERD
jgi:hypothetical protein